MSTNTVLSKQQCLDVLNELNTALDTVAKKYGTDVQTIQRIKRNAEQMNTSEDKDLHETKRRKKLELGECVSRELLKWYKERRKQGDHVTNISMLEKAIEIKICYTFAGYEDFELNFSWIAKFVKKNVVHLSQIEEGVLCNNLWHLMYTQNLHIENIYNMSETRLLWQTLPKNTSKGEEQKIGDYKLQKNRITIALCANVSGNNKVAPFIVHDDKIVQQHLQGTVPLPYRFHEDAKMDQKLFIDWFENHFKPSVQKYQEKKQIPGKVILFIDDRKTHKVLSDHQKSENYEIIYIPTRTAPSIQPIDCNIIRLTKKIFRQLVFHNAHVDNFYENYCLKVCTDILNESWKRISVNDIQRTWLRILPCLAQYYIIDKRPAVKDNSNAGKDTAKMIKICGTEYDAQHVMKYISECEEAENEIEKETSDSIIDSE